MGERIGRITNEHYTVGTGSSEPNGVKNVANGAVTVAASATAIAADELIDIQGALDPAYDANAEWMFKNATLTAIKKLKDGNNNYLWLSGLAFREPDTILGRPFIVNQDMRGIGADKRSLLYGDFSKYWIRDTQDIQVLRLVERFADSAQVGFVAFHRSDGDIIDAGTFPIVALRHPTS